MKAYVEVYGCSANVADYEMILGLLKEAGFRFVDNEYESDVNLIVTCTVKSPTSQRMVYRIKKLTDTKKPLVVAGCMPKTERYLIEKINPYASLVGPNAINKVVDATLGAIHGHKSVFIEDLNLPKLNLPRVRVNPVIGIIEIANGCLSRCSFCQVKIARGDLVSYPISDIVREARNSIVEGCRELWITSQDNGCYGMDIGANLPQLLNELCKIEGDFYIRVGMMNPRFTLKILDELIDVFKNQRIFKFLHLPLQSGSNRILRLMKRGYTSEEFMYIVERFKGEIRDLTLSTDVIVGFPTEGDEDFQMTVDVLERIKPDITNISRFGARPGTEAALLPQLSNDLIKERSEKIHQITRRISLENNKRWVGWHGKVIIDEIVKNGVIGRNFAYKPVFINSQLKLGEEFDVKIVGASSSCLLGELD
ncbi:MAG: tRNA (N(6)-L-threonylcarbamoyladenosine(37)-C(2))-methylthiotransferase [Nitrososphaerota archaeon]|nr:tRNA (N(6)-L-threonylcarbamoyladenosine(37)-C(2))-methylthiotransferase [Nitrososphaerales archaeon]MDW8044928.1 tRNA (N(6)-L-threonylcarbamoyladenosine(37)-C(2))-methylthiotransferase [Nitrososphaerota archaeon]